LILIGSLIYKDYGISVDEPQQREIGKTSLNFIAHFFHISSLIDANEIHANAESVFSTQRDRDYGVIFELPAEFLVKILGLQEENIYYFRHFINYILFSVSVICFYYLLLHRYQKASLALLGVLFLVLSPRIFGDAFYNTKDLAFLSFIVIASYTLVRYLANPNTVNCIWHAIATACAVDVRIMGAMVIGLTCVGLFAQFYVKEKSFSIFLKQVIAYIALTCIFVFIFWPWLWTDPIGHFLEAFKNMSKFRTNLNMLYFGDMVWSGNLPWHYVPTWIFITTPLLYLALFFIGIFAVPFGNNKSLVNEKIQDYLFLTLFFLPIILVIALNSVIYNGWRHLYFVYPSLIYLSIRGYSYLSTLIRQRALLNTLKIIVLCSLGSTTFWMIKDHPYQYLYFNALPKDWVRNFDVDYWGVAYKNSLEKILANSSAEKISIFSTVYYDDNGRALGEFPGQTIWQRTPFESLLMLSQANQDKLIMYRPEECSDHIFLTLKSDKYTEYLKKSEFEVFDTVKSGNKLVYAIFQRKVPLEGGLIDTKLNQPIVFSDPNTHCFLPKGWINNHESWGVWSGAHQARIAVPIPEGANSLQMDLRGFVGGSLKKQIMRVNIPNLPPQNFIIDNFESNLITLNLPPNRNSNEFLKIDISIPDAISPKQLELSEDPRTLGIGLKSITFLK
jgi:hypothetical protein